MNEYKKTKKKQNIIKQNGAYLWNGKYIFHENVATTYKSFFSDFEIANDKIR